MLTEDDIANRLRVEDGTLSIMSSDEANEIAGTFDELRKSRDEWRELCDGERLRADANLELAHGFDDEARALRALLREAGEAITDAREFTATTLAKIGCGHRIAECVQDWDFAIARIDAALKGGDDE